MILGYSSIGATMGTCKGMLSLFARDRHRLAADPGIVHRKCALAELLKSCRSFEDAHKAFLFDGRTPISSKGKWIERAWLEAEERVADVTPC